MAPTVLVTGGAGFIGSHLADEMLAAGYRVRAFDSLVSQVHGEDADRPEYLHDDVELIRGDVRDRKALAAALDGVEGVFHLAARVGVGQSMYQLEEYTAANQAGTAVLLELLAERPVQRLVVASSMSIYGEGLYEDGEGRLVQDADRTTEQLADGRWEALGPAGEPLSPRATPESKHPELASNYALGKYAQERLALLVGRAYDIPVVALRLFNAYGPRQALGNPYTGVLAIFASRLMNGRPPLVNEDGRQLRDFVSVHDVARAFRLAYESPRAPGRVVNIGSGRPRSVRDVAESLAAALGMTEIRPEITGRYRAGDVRHCFADLARARALLGYEPRVKFEEGIRELTDWLRGREVEDRQDEAQQLLARRGLWTRAGPPRERRPRPAVRDGVRATARPVGADGAAVRASRRSERARPGDRGRTLVTGGAGFIGSNLANRLLSEGKPVLVYDNLARGGVRRNLEWLRSEHGDLLEVEIADVRDRDALRRAVARSDAVYHFAAQVAVTTSLDDPVADFEVNARGTLELLEAIRAQDEPPPLLYTSTNKVYGRLDGVDLVRNGDRYEPVDPEVRRNGVGGESLEFCSPYGCAKGAADQYVLDYSRTFGLRTVVFRMSCIYGPRQFGTEDQGWLAHFLLRAREGGPLRIYGDGRQVRDVLYVDDLIDAMRVASTQAGELRGRAFDIGGGPANTISLRELLAEIRSSLSLDPNVEYGEWRPADQRYYVTDIRPFSAATGWSPRVDVREGISRLDDWVEAIAGRAGSRKDRVAGD